MKISGFTVCDSNRKSVLAREVVQNFQTSLSGSDVSRVRDCANPTKNKSEHTHQKMSLRPKCHKFSSIKRSIVVCYINSKTVIYKYHYGRNFVP